MTGEKDPRRQAIGKLAKIYGKRFEARLDQTFEYYATRGYASIEKNEEPMQIIRSMGGGQFLACFRKKAKPDYEGVVKGGRTVMYEAKFTGSDRIEQSRVLANQKEYMTNRQALGARCFVLCGFMSGAVYCVPWDAWNNMKDTFGHKYVTEKDLVKYRVQQSRNGYLLILN